MATSTLIPVILSGGAGTRLWPASRAAYPKPFLPLADGQNLLQKTWLRAAALPGVERLLTVTNRDYYFLSQDAARSLGRELGCPQHYLLEPVGRNTAPALALAAFYAAERHGPDSVLLALAADHAIDADERFSAAVALAARLAAQGELVTFGIRPTEPHTGYGYIELGEPLDMGGRRVARFVEKPDAVTACAYLEGGRHLWNAGIFCFSATTLLDALARHCPDWFEAASAVWQASREQSEGDWLQFDAERFAALPDISIDYALMEKADNVAVVPAEFGWSDVGSWTALAELTPADAEGNRVRGEAVLVDTHNTFIQGGSRLVATVGIDDAVIVDTPDALLVAHRDRVQDVKKVVERLKRDNHESYRLHRTVARPWGTYTVLEEAERFKIKRIVVKPGGSLSLQMHHHRSEHWIVVSGTARVVNDEREFLVRTNESTYIPAGHRHRLTNPGVIDLVMIEVQSGDYLGEDDIVRFEDLYGRR
ncbi:mannose-1-phosphate guanylyltransferase/mannose-6-phosphate isomerase [Chitinimonas lacunae]|uniref:mannose-1-phosphate guanylyltransferase n=1 Tax=Chitinimonas lacunae TaxID=1963018 RepID=A0ABV8MUP9_9NEIS